MSTRPGPEHGDAYSGLAAEHALTRSVRDSAALLNYTEDKTGRYFSPVGYVSGPSQTRLNVAYVSDEASLTGVEPAVLAAHASTAALLEELGHRVVEVPFPIDFDDFPDQEKSRNPAEELVV